jgi:hypothetical protein
MSSAPHTRGVRGAWLLPLLLLSAIPVGAQVDCSNPDNLCTGDPCIITASAVSSPCTVDFGSRAVVIANRLQVGSLNLTARTIAVQANIFNEITVRLFADETIDLDGAIVGAAHLEAGGDINVRRAIKGGTANGIGLEAGNDINVTAPIKSGNILRLTAANDIEVSGPVRADEILFEAGGRLVLNRSVLANNEFGFSLDDVAFHGAGGVDLNGPVNTHGGDIEVVSSAGDVTITKVLRTDGAFNRCFAGNVTITAAGAARISRGISAKGKCGPFFTDGGIVRIEAATVDVGSTARLRAMNSGDIRLTATGGDMLLAGKFFAPGTNGTIEGAATGNLLASGRFTAAPGGCIGLSAGGTLDTAGATFDVPLSTDCPGSPSGAFLD